MSGRERGTDWESDVVPVRQVSLPAAEAAGGYNTAVFVQVSRDGGPPVLVVERVAKPLQDGYDLRVLPSHAVYMAATGSEAGWLPELAHEYHRRRDGAWVQMLSFSGHPASPEDAEDRVWAEAGFAECMESMGHVDTAKFAGWQAANIRDQRDPALQERPLAFDGPPTWDAARRAKLRQLFEEVYQRVPAPFGPDGPGLEELWARLEQFLPPTRAAGPGRLIHFDGKLGNIVLAGDFQTIIDWDSAAVTFAEPEHAAVIDLVRYLHLDGRNPLTTPSRLWLPTAHEWALSLPEAQRPVTQCTQFWGPVGQEALFDLAFSAASDFLRNCDGSVPPEYPANAAEPLLPILGLPRVPATELRSLYSSLHGQAAGNKLIPAEPTHGPERQTTQRNLDAVTMAHIGRQAQSMQRLSAILEDIRQVQERAGLTPTRVPHNLVHTLLGGGSPVVLTAGGNLAAVHGVQGLHLAVRAAAAIRDGLTAGQVDARDPSGWVDLPRLPRHARVLLAHHFPKTSPEPATATARRPGSHRMLPALSAGLPRIDQRTHRRGKQQLDSACAWMPGPGNGPSRSRDTRTLRRALDW